jgi:hypothetical protein
MKKSVLTLAGLFAIALCGCNGGSNNGSQNESKAITYIEANGDYNETSKVWSFPKGATKSSSEWIAFDTTSKQFTISIFKTQTLVIVEEVAFTAQFTWDNYKNADFNLAFSLANSTSVGIYAAKASVKTFTAPGTIDNVTFTSTVDTVPSGIDLSGWKNTAISNYNNLITKYIGSGFPSLI